MVFDILIVIKPLLIMSNIQLQANDTHEIQTQDRGTSQSFRWQDHNR